MHSPVWIDGRLVEPDEAVIRIDDHGLVVGDGVFETIRTERSRPFAVRRHLQRLRRSADGLGIEVPYDDDALRAAVAATLEASALADARVRVTVTGGPSPSLGSMRDAVTATVVVAIAPLAARAESVDVVVVPWRRNELGATTGLKTTSYAENVMALAYANERGAKEAIFANTAGRLCEGTGSNIFCGVGGELITPPLASGCLAGVTRALVIESTGAIEADLALEDLPGVEEAFLTSTTRDVQPITRVDGRDLAVAPGPLTEAAATAFAEVVAADVDP